MILKADSLDEAIRIINRHEYGNGASIYTQNGHYARRFKLETSAGMIGINVGIPAPVAPLPFGGMRNSLMSDTKGQGKAAVYAPELTREALLDALRARRCYGTTAARIFLDARVNGRLMGEEITVPTGEPIVVTARVVGANDLEAVEVCRNNVFIYTRPAAGRQAQFTFRDLKPLAGRSYYYVRVKQKDGELAWSSPVWVTRR